jgi:hypothetical protein
MELGISKGADNDTVYNYACAMPFSPRFSMGSPLEPTISMP